MDFVSQYKSHHAAVQTASCGEWRPGCLAINPIPVQHSLAPLVRNFVNNSSSAQIAHSGNFLSEHFREAFPSGLFLHIEQHRTAPQRTPPSCPAAGPITYRRPQGCPVTL